MKVFQDSVREEIQGIRDALVGIDQKIEPLLREKEQLRAQLEHLNGYLNIAAPESAPAAASQAPDMWARANGKQSSHRCHRRSV